MKTNKEVVDEIEHVVLGILHPVGIDVVDSTFKALSDTYADFFNRYREDNGIE